MPPDVTARRASSAANRHPQLKPGLAIATVLVAVFGVVLAIEALSVGAFGAYVAPSLHVAVFFVAYDLATGLVLVSLVARRLARERSLPEDDTLPPPASVLIAAYDEAGVGDDRGVVGTVRHVAAQTGVDLEILVGDDGSTDGTFEEVVRAFALEDHGGEHAGAVVAGGKEVPVRAFRFTHAGKGATLNALAERARHGVLVTMDADTSPAPRALARLAAAFLDPDVVSAAGVVSVRNARSVLTRHQYAEYVKNSVVRIGWSALGALEQVPGAFAGVRADAFRAVGGFPVDSLTEDYELTYRLVDRGVRIGKVPVVVTVTGAQAFTDVPDTFRGFVRQRTRWFAGFLSTLFRFRHLIARPGAGGFGLVRLPLKLVDAALPLIAFASLVVIVRGASSPILSVSRLACGLFLVRWLWDLVFYAVAMRFTESLGDPASSARVAPERWRGWLCTATEALTYVWLKHASTLRAYAWAVRRARTWEPSREKRRRGVTGDDAATTMVGSPPCAPPGLAPARGGSS